jgi:hypothetical protein
MSEQSDGEPDMKVVKKRADEEAAKPENVAARDKNQRLGADDSRPASSKPHGT